MTGGRALPAAVAEAILERTEGVPLFVEELTKAVLESGLLRETEGGGMELAGPLPPLAIPSTLQDSLMARLDRLAPAKPVAQIGAAIGREFPFKLLAAVADLGAASARRRRSRSWSARGSPSSAAARPRPATRSSMPWSRTPPTSPS